MNLYEKLLNNQKYLKTVQEIEKNSSIINGKWDWDHGIRHYKRVADTARKILQQLNSDERTIELGIMAALLHDIGLCQGKRTDHAQKSSQIFNQFIDEEDLTSEEKNLIRQAIADHSSGNEIQSNIGAALILADKLDITFQRIENSTVHNEINREIQKIKETDVRITDNYLKIIYKADKDFHPDILINWDKAITVPQKVARFLNRKYIFIINDKEIDYKSFLSQ